MKNIPEKIYLQIGDADVTIDNEINDFNDLFAGAITWADSQINDSDIEYSLKKQQQQKEVVGDEKKPCKCKDRRELFERYQCVNCGMLHIDDY